VRVRKLTDSKRKEFILDLLQNKVSVISGAKLAEMLGVTRQVIIKDIALLRAMGYKIEATPKGYTMQKKGGVQTLFAVRHSVEEIEKELSLIVKNGGTVMDVIVEHPLYGELRGNLEIETMEDVSKFLTKMQISHAKPLLVLSEGIHLHTVRADSSGTLERVKNALREAGFLVSSS